MSGRTSTKSKGKAKVEVIDLTLDEPLTANKAVQVQLPLPISPPRNARPTTSTLAGNSKAVPPPSTRVNPSTPIRAGSSNASFSSPFSPTQGTKRKAEQARITSFFPAKKLRIETIPAPLTPDEKKAAKEEEKTARADARRLAKELEKEAKELEKEEKKAAEEKTKAKKAEERRLKKEARDAEAARKREIAQWRADWKDWVQRNRQPDAEFTMPKGEDMWENHVNIKGAKELDLTRHELDCLEHCDVKNPMQPAGEEWAPMKLYRVAEVEKLAYRKEGIVNGVSQDDEAALLREGEEKLKTRMGKNDNEDTW
jgi:hypothetical protein